MGGPGLSQKKTHQSFTRNKDHKRWYLNGPAKSGKYITLAASSMPCWCADDCSPTEAAECTLGSDACLQSHPEVHKTGHCRCGAVWMGWIGLWSLWSVKSGRTPKKVHLGSIQAIAGQPLLNFPVKSRRRRLTERL